MVRAGDEVGNEGYGMSQMRRADALAMVGFDPTLLIPVRHCACQAFSSGPPPTVVFVGSKIGTRAR